MLQSLLRSESALYNKAGSRNMHSTKHIWSEKIGKFQLPWQRLGQRMGSLQQLADMRILTPNLIVI